MKKEYAWCRRCGSYVCRIPGHLHGDGQFDNNDCPVWLLASDEELAENGINIDDLPEVICCNN